MRLYCLGHLVFELNLNFFQGNCHLLDLLSITPVTKIFWIKLFALQTFFDILQRTRIHLLINLIKHTIQLNLLIYNQYNFWMSLSLAEISSNTIEFPQRSQKNPSYTYELKIKNTSEKERIMFKIKTKRLNTYEVKPPKNILQAKEQKKVLFKIVRPLGEDQFEEISLKDKFLIQIIQLKDNDVSEDLKNSKEKLSRLWKRCVQNNGNYQSSMLSVAFAGKHFNLIQSKSLKKSNSHESDAFSSNFRKQHKSQNIQKKQKISDDKLSRIFDELKTKQQKLMQERQKIFKPAQYSGKQLSTSPLQICLMIIVFLVSLMIGNFLKLRVFVSENL